jgi:hypothetical protein
MDLDNLQRSLTRLIAQHHVEFETLGRRETQALEVGALVLAVEHYRRAGYTSRANNLSNNAFKMKLSSSGNSSNFSWYEVERDGRKYEIHANLPVASATDQDEGVYVVDVGITRSGAVPRAVRRGFRVDNDKLVSFIEAKKLVVYPMLLAQFVGIVHEIKPRFLGNAPKMASRGHFYPALVCLGYFTATSGNIVDGFVARKYRLNVVPTFDAYVSRLAVAATEPSPFKPKSKRAHRPRPVLDTTEYAKVM